MKKYKLFIFGDDVKYDVVERVIAQSGFTPKELLVGDLYGVGKVVSWYAEKHNVKLSSYKTEWANITVDGAKVKINAKGEKYNCLAAYQRDKRLIEMADAIIVILNDSKWLIKTIEEIKKMDKKLFIWEI